MKESLIKIIYPILDFIFPYTLAQKIKICGCVLINGYDVPFIYPEVEGLNKEKIKEIYGSFSQNSLDILDRFETHHNRSLLLPKNKQLCYSMFVKTSLFLTKEEERIRAKDKKRCLKLGKKYGIKHALPESILYHHGLKELPSSVINYIKGKIFLDVGACDGVSTMIFSWYHPSLVYCIEPEKKNLNTIIPFLKRNHVPQEQYQIFNLALGDEPCELCISENGGSSTLSISGEGDKIKVITCDQLMKENPGKVGVIKADVEGFGLKLVQGAMETIKKDRPLLLLSIYHNADEFFKIYPLLETWGLNYHFEIFEGYKAPSFEINLIGYPKELTENKSSSNSESK